MQINLEILHNSILNKDVVKLRPSIFEWFCKDLQQLERYVMFACNNNGHFVIDNFPHDFVKNINLSFDADLHSLIEAINDDSKTVDKHTYSLGKIKFNFYFYKLFDEAMQNYLEEDLPCTFHTFLPSIDFVGLWESLVFEDDLKYKLINYVRTSIIFAKKNVNTSLVNWNKVILLHGPPGTGKTSLCKALCQKLAIIMSNQYEIFQLVEINAHSLFSKWFSESGKLVLKLFDGIRSFAQDSSTMVFVLIDEVESLVYDRQRANGSDPSDAIRVVNALLTQLDSIKRYPNVIILANSNVTNSMDTAFVDRVDIKQFVGYPSHAVIYQIYYSCIQELISTGLIKTDEELPLWSYNQISSKYIPDKPDNSMELIKLSMMSETGQFTGRTLRKLPFLAFALYSNGKNFVTLPEYLKSLEQVIIKQVDDNKHFNNISNSC